MDCIRTHISVKQIPVVARVDGISGSDIVFHAPELKNGTVMCSLALPPSEIITLHLFYSLLGVA